jgi:hypothetical protein
MENEAAEALHADQRAHGLWHWESVVYDNLKRHASPPFRCKDLISAPCLSLGP